MRLEKGVGVQGRDLPAYYVQAIQKFAALGDIIIGGSQDLMACGVWTIARMALLVNFAVLLRRIKFNFE